VQYSESEILELEIVAASYRLVADASAFDKVIDSLTRRFDMGDTFDSKSIEAGLLSRHLHNVSKMLEKAASDEGKDTIAEIIKSVAVPTAVISPSNLVVALNNAASEAWDIRHGSTTDLQWIDATSLEDLDEVRRSATDGSVPLHAILRTIDDQGELKLAEAFVLDPVERPGMVAVRVMELVWTEALNKLLSDSFDFTNAEIDVAKHFLSKRDLAEIAEIRTTSLLTVRKQLWSIFAKTETNSQVDLIRLLATLSAHMARQIVGVESPWRDPLDREETFVDPSTGRTIAYTWAGDPNGKPALLSHGLTTGYLWQQSAMDMLEQGGVKLFLISRPGFGNSDPSPVSSALQANAGTILALERHLGIDNWVAVGQGTGTLPLFRAAGSSSSAISTIVSVGTYLPIVKGDRFEKLPPTRRLSMRLAQASPILADFSCRLFYRTMRAEGPDFIVRALYNKGGADAQYAKTPDCIAFMRTAYSMLCTHHHKAVASDLQMLVDDRTNDFEKCECFVQFVHGDNDPANPIEPIREFIDGRSNMELKSLDGAGELLFFSHCDAIAGTLVEMVRAAP